MWGVILGWGELRKAINAPHGAEGVQLESSPSSEQHQGGKVRGRADRGSVSPLTSLKSTTLLGSYLNHAYVSLSGLSDSTVAEVAVGGEWGVCVGGVRV